MLNSLRSVANPREREVQPPPNAGQYNRTDYKSARAWGKKKLKDALENALHDVK